MRSSSTTLSGVFLHLVYGPKGDHEGALVEVDGAPHQLVFDHHDVTAAAAFGRLAPGQRVDVKVTPPVASPKGDGVHPVHSFVKLLSVDGKAPSPVETGVVEPAYRGRVVRLNHARHGAPNGVVLDSGDFLHLTPRGMDALKLKPGDIVTADGDAQRLVDDSGWAVEATTVNGHAVRHH